MNEEFIIRIGANARAMYSELQRAGSWTKAWGLSLAEDLKHHFGRVLTAGFALVKAEEMMDRIKERILAIHHAEENLGASSNFIQGVFNWVEKVGISFDKVEKPLLKFKQTLDAAKADPGGKQAQDLARYGIATDAAALKNQRLSDSLAKLSEAYLKSGKNLALVKDLLGKESLSPAFLALLSKGPEAIREMEGGNVFTKLTPGSIGQFSALYSGTKTTGQVVLATLGNLVANAINNSGLTILGRALGELGDIQGILQHPLQSLNNIRNGVHTEEKDGDAELAKSIEMEQRKVEINTHLLSLKEKQHELEAAIADRGKSSVSQLATEARQLLGIQAPRNYGVSARMRTALNIDTLERKAQIAWERGDDAGMKSLLDQAQSLRANNSFLSYKDQNPLQGTESQLAIVNQQLAPVAAMAEFVNQEHGVSKTSPNAKKPSGSNNSGPALTAADWM